MEDLRDRVVVITGGASGIGLATARAFAREGARLHLVDIDAEAVEGAAAELGGTPHVVDCRDPEALHALAEAVLEAEGRVDVLHNNAGVGVGKPFHRTTADDWAWILDLNLGGVIHGTRAFLPAMRARGEGAIVNTASLSGLIGPPLMSAYATTKFGVVGFSESLRAEYGREGIQVTALCPGFVRTRIGHVGRYDLPRDDEGTAVADLIERMGIEPARVGAAVVDAVRRDRPLVVLPASARWMVRLKRLSPALFRRLVPLIERLTD